MSETRYRMQSLRTGWGVEALATPEGKQELLRLRKEQKDKFKWSRIYLVRQTHPEVNRVGVPFELTHRKYC
jgi:hypothetical protein